MTTQTTTRKIKRIVPTTLAKAFTVIYGLIGLIVAFFAALVKASDFAYSIGFLFGFTAIYIISGYLVGLITAFFYNIAAKYTGGVAIEIE